MDVVRRVVRKNRSAAYALAAFCLFAQAHPGHLHLHHEHGHDAGGAHHVDVHVSADTSDDNHHGDAHVIDLSKPLLSKWWDTGLGIALLVSWFILSLAAPVARVLYHDCLPRGGLKRRYYEAAPPLRAPPL